MLGDIVISTGSGPVVRLTVDVETPQAWRLSATQTGDEAVKRVLREGQFIDDTAVR
jgi:predicted transcriptional regulator